MRTPFSFSLNGKDGTIQIDNELDALKALIERLDALWLQNRLILMANLIDPELMTEDMQNIIGITTNSDGEVVLT